MPWSITLTKAELVDSLAQQSELSKPQVEELVDGFLDELTSAVRNEALQSKEPLIDLVSFRRWEKRQEKKVGSHTSSRSSRG